MFWDTHAHIYMLDNPSEVIGEMQKNGIAGCICPAVDLATSHASIALAEAFKGIIGSCVGLHPNEQPEDWKAFEQLAKSSSPWAIGETGLDYYRDTISPDIQKERFIQHINLAKTLNIPLIVHVRQAAEDVLDILKQYADGITVILHSFTESTEVAHRALDLGCYISFSGIVTFKNAQYLRDTLATLPLHRILIETDSPYLSPEPVRGRVNHPAHVVYVARTIALVHQVSVEDISQQLQENTRHVFTRISA